MTEAEARKLLVETAEKVLSAYQLEEYLGALWLDVEAAREVMTGRSVREAVLSAVRREKSTKYGKSVKARFKDMDKIRPERVRRKW